jgi:hypothetical protein
MGGLTHVYQASLFQEVDLVDQSGHLRYFKWIRLFTPGSMELGEFAIPGENFSREDQVN